MGAGPGRPRKTPGVALTAQQRRFCQLFTTLGNATEAYRAAGYSTIGAKEGAAQLLRKREVRDEIARLKTAEAEYFHKSLTTAGSPPIAPDGVPASMRRDVMRATVAALSADWITAALIEAVEIGLGRRPVKAIFNLPREPDPKTGEPRAPVPFEVQAYKIDLGGANRAAELLTRDLALRTGQRGQLEDVGDAVIEQMAAFLEKHAAPPKMIDVTPRAPARKPEADE